jgi:predicted nucleotidyltransferase
MELDSYFRGLLSKIEPNSAAVKTAKKAHEDLRAILQEDEEISKADPDTYLSGSYARDTALNSIKDVDVILLIEMDHKATEPEIVVAWLQEALQRHYTKVRSQGRSVQVTTATGFDLDVVPSVPISSRNGPVWIPDREVQQWVATHPKGQLAFGVEKNDSTEGYYKPLVKIMKYWRDRLPNETARAKSYILESLVAGCLPSKPKSFGHGVAEIFRSIFSINSPYLSLNIVPKIQDPGYPSVNVAKRWKFSEFSAFMVEIESSHNIAIKALATEGESESVKLWRKLFSNKFSPK